MRPGMAEAMQKINCSACRISTVSTCWGRAAWSEAALEDIQFGSVGCGEALFLGALILEVAEEAALEAWFAEEIVSALILEAAELEEAAFEAWDPEEIVSALFFEQLEVLIHDAAADVLADEQALARVMRDPRSFTPPCSPGPRTCWTPPSQR